MTYYSDEALGLMTEDEKWTRQRALELALSGASQYQSAAAVIEAAELFLIFLQGKPTALADTSDPAQPSAGTDTPLAE